MNFALARRGDAPQWMVRLNGRGVPARAILIATSIGFLSVIANVISPEKVFLFLLNSSGAVALFVYLLIAISQLVMRRRLEREDPERLKVRMWLYPYLTWLRDRRDRRRDRLDGVRRRRRASSCGGPRQPRRRAGRGVAASMQPWRQTSARGTRALDELIRDTLPDLEVVRESDDMIGYGPFHYRYASGREGDMPRVRGEPQGGHSLDVLA